MPRIFQLILVHVGFVSATQLPAVTPVAGTPLKVGIAIMPGIFISEMTIPFDMYKHVAGAHTMDVYLVAEDMNPVTTAYGTRLLADYTFANAPAPDVLVVPSGRGSHHSFLTEWYGGATDANGNIVGQTTNDQPVMYYGNMTSLIDWVRTTSATASIVTSHCWGAFTLAEAGVLDGLSVTTFPGYTDALMQYYPAIGAVVTDQRFVVDGKVMTSNGAVAAFEACLAVIRHIYGAGVADPINTGLVLSPENIGHSNLEYFRPSPAATGSAPAASGNVTKVGILLLNGAYISEPVGPFDIFVHMGAQMNVYFVGESMDPVQTNYGATLYPDYTVANAPSPDVLVVPSGNNSRGSDRQKTAVINWLRTTGASATWVTSHCWGAFMLGEAGLLDGRTATTFPGSYFQELRDAFPAIGTVIENNRIVRDGNIVTSNGGVAAYEAANYVVLQIYGEYHARTVATGLVFSADNYAVMAGAYVASSSSSPSTTSAAGTSTVNTTQASASAPVNSGSLMVFLLLIIGRVA